VEKDTCTETNRRDNMRVLKMYMLSLNNHHTIWYIINIQSRSHYSLVSDIGGVDVSGWKGATAPAVSIFT
jgi:hypothetical protein